MVESERPSRKNEGKDERRAQLLHAARKVFCMKGYHAATVDDITRAAGVAKGTFYLYFSEKKVIFYEIIEQFFKLVTQVGMSVARDVRTKRDYFIRVEEAANSLVRLFEENRDLVRLTYRESMGLDEHLERMVREFYRKIAEVEADNIRLGIDLGLFRDDIHPLLAAYAQIGMIERVLLQWQFDRSFPQIAGLERQIVELAYTGLKQRKS